MNILYICYWGIEEGLTSSSVFPHLEILAENHKIEKIFFSTIERGGAKVQYKGPDSNKIIYTPLYSKNLTPSVLNKVSDFILFPRELIALSKTYKIDKIIGRGSPAGAIASKVSKATGIPYIVESFEPHADYMYEAGIWTKWNPKYIFEKRWENEIKKSAEYLVPVSENYRKKLVEHEQIDFKKTEVVPCCVNIENFRFNAEVRARIREKLKIDNKTTVGVYVGKFGGVYYESEAFLIFKKAFDMFDKNMFLIILSPENENKINENLKKVSFPLENTFVGKVKHTEVPDYLSASDFAFSTIKPSPSRIFCSAIKNGEYWANGLPILVTEGVGDDTDIISKENSGGAVYNLAKNNLEEAILQIKDLVLYKTRDQNNKEISVLAEKYRNFDLLKNSYKKMLDI